MTGVLAFLESGRPVCGKKGWRGQAGLPAPGELSGEPSLGAEAALSLLACGFATF